jgi:hypothetical protein
MYIEDEKVVIDAIRRFWKIGQVQLIPVPRTGAGEISDISGLIQVSFPRLIGSEKADSNAILVDRAVLAELYMLGILHL